MRLSEVEMIKLLPSWMAQDGADRGLATPYPGTPSPV